MIFFVFATTAMSASLFVDGCVRPSVGWSVYLSVLCPVIEMRGERPHVVALGGHVSGLVRFLDAFSHLYKRIFPSIYLSVCQSVGPCHVFQNIGNKGNF